MPRPSWRGHLRLSLVSCPIYLSPATVRTKPIRLHQVWRAAPVEGGGDLEDQVGGEDVPERPASRFTLDHDEDEAERARPATRIGPYEGSQEGLTMPTNTITRARLTFEKRVRGL